MILIQNENNKMIKERKRNIEMNKGNLYPNQTVKNSILINYNSECNYLYFKLSKVKEYYDDEYVKFKFKTIIQFQKLVQKLKIKIQEKYKNNIDNINNDNNDIIYNFNQDFNKAILDKENRKKKQWKNQFETKQNEENEEDKDYQKYDPAQMNLPEVNLVNITNKQRNILAKNFGNFHDKFAYKQYQKSINKTRKESKYNNNINPRKQRSRSNFR